MFYQNQMNNNSCGCGCNQEAPTYQQCNQVLQTCNVQDVPHYTNYHTHIINNCIKRHINIPTYSASTENVYINEYVAAEPMYQQPYMYNQPQAMYQQPYAQGQYQGNVAVEGVSQNQYFNPYQGMNNPSYPFGN